MKGTPLLFPKKHSFIFEIGLVLCYQSRNQGYPMKTSVVLIALISLFSVSSHAYPLAYKATPFSGSIPVSPWLELANTNSGGPAVGLNRQGVE